MEYLPKDLILNFNHDTLQAVRKIHGLNETGRMEESIAVLEDWVKKQNHFVKKDYSKHYLERLIVACKGSVERAKKRLDKLCTMRTLMPHFFEDYHIRTDFKVMLEKIWIAPLPNLTEEHERIVIVQLSGNQYEPKIYSHAFILSSMFAEYFRAHDYANSFIIISDIRSISVSEIVTNIDIMEMHQAVIMLMEGYGARVKGIHLLTTSKIIDTLVAILKQVFSDKIGKRIHVHKTLESLQEVVPKAVFPIEYGGEERSFKKIYDEWLDILSSNSFREYRHEMNQACTNEACRQTDIFNEQYMGMPGSFRSLVVD